MTRGLCRPPLALFAAAGLLHGVALAQPRSDRSLVERCASAYEEAQRRQSRGELIAAREQAGACAARACPAEIVSYCSKLAEELDATTPTVVVVLTDGRGRDVDAKLLVDDREAQAHLDGRPLRLDPGRHRLRLVPPASGARPVEIEVTLRSGERNRRIEMKVDTAPEPARRQQAALGYAPSIVAFVVGGVGLLVGTTTGVMALSQDADLADACDAETATCGKEHQPEIERATNLGYASTVGFVVGGLGVATGVILAIVAARAEALPAEPTRTGFRVRF